MGAGKRRSHKANVNSVREGRNTSSLDVKKRDQRKIVCKSDKLDWSGYNFLENMLLFCITENLSVPEEGSIRFHLNRIDQQTSFCLLFHFDRSPDPLVREEGQPRPDYVAFYFEKDQVICTIIEMKGTKEHNLKHGVQQILKGHEILKKEISTHLPRKLKIIYQGILLAPLNSEFPNREIDKTLRKSNFVIKPMQVMKAADLSSFISKQLTANDVKIANSGSNSSPSCPKTSSGSDTPQLIGQFLAKRGLRLRKNESTRPEFGICVDYFLREEGYMSLRVSPDSCMLLFFDKHIKTECESILKCIKQCKFDQNCRIEIRCDTHSHLSDPAPLQA